MNNTQRNFLVERVKEKTNKKISELEKKKEDYPSTSNYIFKAILNDKLELQPQEVILAALKKKALAAKEGENWLSKETRLSWDREKWVKLAIEELIKLPDDYSERYVDTKSINIKIDEEIRALKSQLETLEVRIQLASNKTLQNLINEVDDMGDLSLVDKNLRLLE